jgi:protein O-GlcNAc transferase
MNEQELIAMQSRLERLKGFLKADPNNRELLIDCGKLSHRLGHFEEAYELFHRAMAFLPNDPQVLAELGKLALSENKPEAAASFFRQALDIEKTPETLANLGIALNYSGSWDEAATCLTEATKLLTDWFQLYRHLAVAEHHRGRYAEAIAAAAHWHDLAEDAQSAGYLSLIHLDCEQWDDAERYAKEALTVDPEQSDANIVLGTLALNNMRITQAANYYAVANSQPGNGRALFGLGLSHLCQQEPEAAEGCLQLAVEAMPDHVTGWVTLGWAKIGLGRYDEALSNFERAVACDRNFAEAQGGLASAYALTGRMEEAEQREKVANRLDPNNFGGIFARSVLTAHRGNTAEAQRMIREGMARPVLPGMPSLQSLAQRMLRRSARRPNADGDSPSSSDQ